MRENFFSLKRDSNSVITYEEGTYPEAEVVHWEKELTEKEGKRMWAPVVSYLDQEEEHLVHWCLKNRAEDWDGEVERIVEGDYALYLHYIRK